MRETVNLSGVVLLAQAIGEYDKRLLVLSKERGKITVFAHGVRRAKSSLLAACQPFVFADFSLYEGREAYSLSAADVKYYFTELSALPEGIYLGFYCLELADYFGREGIEAGAVLDLLFLTLRAILKEQLELRLIRRIYTCRLLTLQGEFRPPSEGELSPRGRHAVLHIMSCELSALYGFRLAETLFLEVAAYIDRQMKHAVDRPLKSLQMLPETL